jgi:hypothetical protein
MIKFIDKLVQETKDGLLDYVWEFYGNDRFKYNADKHPLKDLNFSLSDVVTKEEEKPSGKTKIVPDNTKGLIVFPNGAGMEVDRQKLEILNSECTNAIIRAMESTASRYANGTIQAEIEATKAKAEADAQKKKQDAKLNQKSKETPTNEKQENKPKV